MDLVGGSVCVVFYTVILIIGLTTATFGPEGCEKGFLFKNDYCYRFESAETDFDVAKGTCISFRSPLTSLWNQEEIDFVTAELQKLHVPAAWIGLTPTKNKKWMWLDGSFCDITNKDTPKASRDICATITADGEIRYVNCDVIIPGFVCKRTLDRLYVPTSINISSDIQYSDTDTSQTIFERLWPPTLSLVSITESEKSCRLATIDVARETDCAYRCYTVDDCRAFILRCKTVRKCNSVSCTLLSCLVHA